MTAIIGRYERGDFSMAGELDGERHYDANSLPNDLSLFRRGGVSLLFDEVAYIAAKTRQRSAFDPVRFVEDYRSRGEDAFDDLDGQFAIALHDAANGKLYLARDAFGTRPLFIAQLPYGFAFSTTYGPLSKLPELHPAFNVAAVRSFIESGWVPAGFTFHRDIRTARAGFLEIFDRHSHWIRRLPPRPNEYTPPTDALSSEELLSLLRRTVAESLERSHGEIGVSLSGGIDSAAIAALLKKADPRRILRSFTVGYGEEDPEIQGGRATASHLGLEHHEIIIGAQDLASLMQETVQALGNPGGYDEFACLFALWRDASRSVQTLFSGNLSDTLFGGMPYHRDLWLRMHDVDSRKDRSGSADVRQADQKAPRDLLFEDLRQSLTDWDERIGAQTLLASRANVELIMPLSRRSLLDLSLRLPARQKVTECHVKSFFRESIGNLFPPEIVERPKGIQQLRYDADMRDALLELSRMYLTKDRVERHAIVSPADVQACVSASKDHFTRAQFQTLWNMLIFEIWTDAFANAPPQTARIRGTHRR
ncbi:asparagine synthase [Mesorhizobium plurifarium]|uniref:asparagine synthase-related protein n=1 Tax=Sinorhizobium arboris TaxID=76745 RepID=UPI0004160C88|nr:asparagine synthase-related protein [Sinorhizobium arboris]PST20776.1 asparagine synthase [Mesorhizobium plurifarium]